ncbi:MAG: hypothetical protein A2452_06250 [Candidatus Firestonebacteria bacterium RIFOXYC2_FULL_39_67]|nr:MAG: hypothetical protein A2536_00885 [Candidatus Firestonebacteria bacterium RIFOXYD2_FULL_39_29]OGF53824.1 MAG: hypothetical protein A2452_06250 [Candidatus Firestonebacteria bacterium RIFOXYC2_FULL_39_67]OGF56847.1 MAG: hypothetical protein A2497_02285 [Candidatus Firestonebacteria bacterium RifOxyC12_full_39_7]
MLIEINLLPESYYKAKRLKQMIALGILIVIVVVTGMVGLYLVTLAQVQTLKSQIKEVESKQQEFTQTLIEMENIKKTNASVKEYLDVINELKDKQVYWLLILDSFNKTIPNNIWLNSLSNKVEAGGVRTFTATGVALYKESVADFATNLNESTGFFRNAFVSSMTEAVVNGRISNNFVLSFQAIEDAKIRPPKQMVVQDVSKTGVYGNNYINKEHNCSLFVPDGWRIGDSIASSNVLAVIVKEKRDIKSKYTPMVTLAVEKLSKPNITSKEFQEANEVKFSKWQGYKKISEKEFTINGEKVYDLGFRWLTKSKSEKNKTVTLEQRQIFCVKGGKGFIITCSDSEEGFRNSKEEFGIIFNSLRVQ